MPLVTTTEMFKKAYDGGYAIGAFNVSEALPLLLFMKDLNEFGKMNAVYGQYFKEAPPSRATVEVARLPRDARVEIAVIATK